MKHLFKARFLSFAFVLLATAAFGFDTITGTVHNETTGKPAAGDEVVLLRLGNGMEVESRARTDAQGAFTLEVTSPQGQHLLQVSHQGVNYNQPVTGRGPFDVIVYDAVARVSGLSGTFGFVQLASEGKTLRVTEMYEISNKSNPPVTQSGKNSFALTLLPNAVIDSAQARKGRGMWLKVAVAPLPGEKGKYAVDFPIRPGETQLNLAYHLPYQGSATLDLKVPYPMDKFFVAHPSSMIFKGLTAGAFKSGELENGLMGELPGNGAIAGDVPVFEISGTGLVPPHRTQASAGPAPAAPGVAPARNVPPAQNTATAVPEQASKETWLMIGGIIVLLGVGAFTFWRMGIQRAPVAASTSSGAKQPLLDGLKEELFQLESDRLHGTISAEEYAGTKQALSESIRRAMEQKGSS